MPKPICFVVDTEAGEVEHKLPSRFEICDCCRGEGSRDHPAFRNGISRQEFDEDPDFEEAYFSGRYDVRCEDCDGSGKIVVPDENAMTPAQRELLKLYEEEQADAAREARADAHTRFMESGGRY